MTIVSIHQPTYLPWLGFFNKIISSEKFVFLDDVKFVKREWKNRNKIRKTSFSDEYKWLTVPVEKNSRDNLLSETKIYDKSNWRNKHLNGISSVYAKSPNFEKFYPQNDPETTFFEEHRKKFSSDNDFLLVAIKNNEGVFRKDFLLQVKEMEEVYLEDFLIFLQYQCQ